uniref:Fas binding factor 1 n=1 Tax=Sphenodon punctatus TaxID=8508 RepID=A0A8D0GMT2_SPHPU
MFTQTFLDEALWWKRGLIDFNVPLEFCCLPFIMPLQFLDLDDPLAGLLSDEEEEDVAKKPPPSATRSTSLASTPGPVVAPARKREELTFDGDDLMDALGFGESPKTDLKLDRKGEEEEPSPARSKLDELLGRGTAAKLLERPATGERREFKLDKKYQKQTDKEDTWGDEDFTFGAYQPTLASTPEGRQSRRQSVRFSSENLTELKTEPRSKPTTPATASPRRGSKTGGDWLGLKDEDFFDSAPPSPAKEPSQGSSLSTPLNVPPSPSEAKQPSPAAQALLETEERGVAEAELGKDGDDSWLNNALSRKKSQGPEKTKETRPSDSLGGREELDLHARRCVCVFFPPGARPPSVTVAAFLLSSVLKMFPFCLLAQLLPAEPLALSLLNVGENEKRLAMLQTQLRESVAGYQVELLSAQTHLAEVESQVRRLELEKSQQKLLLESLRHQHQEDLELIENAHRGRVKVMEESYWQREERLKQENQELSAQYLAYCQSTEQAKSELLAQQQRRFVELEQEKAKEVERLRELQRVSIVEMCKDHEEQLRRLKRLKDQEIDAVTSATSYTRSLNGVIEQMEKFSGNLSDLSSKVEATHLSTSQEMEIGTRQRDEQLRVLQDRLTRQQRDMEEERSRLQEVITKMEARLSEQTRLLEQERWRVAAEQSKVESLQRSLEEQRRLMTQQLAMEREELERAKNALLEEQKSVMQKCAEERRKLAAEWSEFHTQQKLSKERAERDVDRALQIDSQREGAIMSMAKEQADLKIKASELRAKEMQLARERESLEQQRQDLRLEKERVNAAALHVKQRAEEMDSMSKLSSQKYEEGERALLEAKKVESEHQSRLRGVQQQLEWLRQQEQHLHQVSVLLALTFFLCVSQIRIPQQVSQGPVPVAVPPNSLPHTGNSARDRDFLEDERFFLETLKKASYNTSSQMA